MSLRRECHGNHRRLSTEWNFHSNSNIKCLHCELYKMYLKVWFNWLSSPRSAENFSFSINSHFQSYHFLLIFQFHCNLKFKFKKAYWHNEEQSHNLQKWLFLKCNPQYDELYRIKSSLHAKLKLNIDFMREDCERALLSLFSEYRDRLMNWHERGSWIEKIRKDVWCESTTKEKTFVNS